jgi:hypothetical protein
MEKAPCSSRYSLPPACGWPVGHFSHTLHLPPSLRPEGAAFNADNIGFGTLLYSRATDDSSLSPRIALGPLHADGSSREVHLEWVSSSLAKTYTIARSDRESRGYRTIAAGVVEPTFKDTNVKSGQSYSYHIAPSEAEQAARQISVTAGLPPRWSERTYGRAFPTGNTNVEGNTFRVQAYGYQAFGYTDELHFVHTVFNEVGILTVCLSSLLASQSATMGLMLRAGDTADAPMIALSVSPSSEGERPQWVVLLLSRDNTAESVRTVNTLTLDVPFVTWGRIVRPIWLRLSRRGKNFILSSRRTDWLG